ncbi:hypothetical protein PoB_005017600 [Plakobranchus ocellatus]|uniref:Uncharacterized protein n=1 Tax=Plakobranchus ocellatus TaxID=259542 RepID=A0AAV4BX44_9GAST|nr:hypothetical protein PoB_005017600 [Plakobranchus ocellatus]
MGNKLRKFKDSITNPDSQSGFGSSQLDSSAGGLTAQDGCYTPLGDSSPAPSIAERGATGDGAAKSLLSGGGKTGDRSSTGPTSDAAPGKAAGATKGAAYDKPCSVNDTNDTVEVRPSQLTQDQASPLQSAPATTSTSAAEKATLDEMSKPAPADKNISCTEPPNISEAGSGQESKMNYPTRWGKSAELFMADSGSIAHSVNPWVTQAKPDRICH